MQKIIFQSRFFNAHDTLNCGQIFRFKPFREGFLVFSTDKVAYLTHEDEFTGITINDGDEKYFANFFDLDRDYFKIYESAKEEDVDILRLACEKGKGIRILNQDPVETTFSFIISQNNNIPRIKGIIEKLCKELGERKLFLGEEYFAFPTAENMSKMPESFYQSLGLGYRAKYIKSLADNIANGLNLYSFSCLETDVLKFKLQSLLGVGPKVADCVALFGYHRSDSFPVDTWIEKVYKQDFGGKENSRDKITDYFLKKFKNNAGYYQQYLFYYKREIENRK